MFVVPAGDPPHKQDRRLAPVEDRLRMIDLAIAGNPAFRASRVDADRPGPHYTIDTVRIFQEQLPPDCELYFLMGYDSLAELPGWYRPAGVGRGLPSRGPDALQCAAELGTPRSALPGIRDRVTLLDMPEIEIASHQIQERVRQGRSIRYLVPDPVREYIVEHGSIVEEASLSHSRASNRPSLRPDGLKEGG